VFRRWVRTLSPAEDSSGDVELPRELKHAAASYRKHLFGEAVSHASHDTASHSSPDLRFTAPKTGNEFL